MGRGSQSNYPQGVPNPRRLSCGIDLMIGEYLTDQSAAIEAVCRALGRPSIRVDGQGYEHEIVGGAVDGNRVAWVEGRSKQLGSYVDVEFRLRAQVEGRPVIDWEVATYNPYFGCHVQLMRWLPRHVVAVYHEKHRILAAAVSLNNESLLLPIDVRWGAVGDTLLYRSDEPDLIEVIALPDLTRRLPVPLRLLTTTRREDWPLVLPTDEQGRLPADPERFQASLRERLFGQEAPQPAADLITGSLAHRFWDPWPQPASQYGSWASRWNSPGWLPFYWGLHLGEAEREGYLSLLDHLAQMPPRSLQPDWSPEECACELAASYVAARAAVIATACRASYLPGGEHCYFWCGWSATGFERDLQAFPAGMAEPFGLLKQEQARWEELQRSQSERNWAALRRRQEQARQVGPEEHVL